MEDSYDYLFKMLIVGDSNVGKTSLLLRYVEDKFSEHHMVTIGVDTKSKTVYLEDHNKTVKLQFWDTAGQERFRSMSRMYWTGVTGVLLVFSIDDKASFDHLDEWLADIKQHSSCQYILLAGNKSDVAQDKRQVSHKQGTTLQTSMA